MTIENALSGAEGQNHATDFPYIPVRHDLWLYKRIFIVSGNS